MKAQSGKSRKNRKESEKASKKWKEADREERNCVAGAAYCGLARSRRLPLFSKRVLGKGRNGTAAQRSRKIGMAWQARHFRKAKYRFRGRPGPL